MTITHGDTTDKWCQTTIWKEIPKIESIHLHMRNQFHSSAPMRKGDKCWPTQNRNQRTRWEVWFYCIPPCVIGPDQPIPVPPRETTSAKIMLKWSGVSSGWQKFQLGANVLIQILWPHLEHRKPCLWRQLWRSLGSRARRWPGFCAILVMIRW